MSPESGRTYQILIADDHPFIQKFYGTALAELPVRCYYASDGNEAVRVAEQIAPDLILMDYRMPGLDGEKACLRIRETPALAATTIIALTAESRTKAESLKGFDGYLLKPVRAEAVLELVCQRLGI
ncbi:MAG: response regulator, partial [Bdellovibrionota bacterium]